MGGIQELRCIQLLHTPPHPLMVLSSVVSAVRYMMMRKISSTHTFTPPHTPPRPLMVLSSVVSAVRYMMLRKISSTPVHTHPHLSTLTHAAFICGLGRAVHDVAQDLVHTCSHSSTLLHTYPCCFHLWSRQCGT